MHPTNVAGVVSLPYVQHAIVLQPRLAQPATLDSYRESRAERRGALRRAVEGCGGWGGHRRSVPRGPSSCSCSERSPARASELYSSSSSMREIASDLQYSFLMGFYRQTDSLNRCT